MRNILFALLLTPLMTFAQFKGDIFTLDKRGDVTNIPIRCTFDKDTVIMMPIKTAINGLSLSGVARLMNNNDSYIRVILEDNYNYEHLIYENYPLLSDGLVTEFNNIALETKFLDSVTPQSIRIELHKATLKISSFQYTTCSSNKDGGIYSAGIQKAQTQYIADKLNENLTKCNMLWRAGVTSLSEKSYEEKKMFFGGKVPLLHGYDYYKGGIFSIPEETDVKKSFNTSNRTADTDQYVLEWDWRDRHGKNWMTPAKDQFTCNSCVAFSAIGVLEACVNLYYNQLLDYDLSEQELISCIDSFYCNRGMVADKPLIYFKDHGSIPDTCFKYQNQVSDCSMKCDNPLERVFIEGYGTTAVYAEEGVLKEQLFKAPMMYGVYSWNHEMVLVGYKKIQLGDTIMTGVNSYDYIVIDTIHHQDKIGKTAWLVKNSSGPSWGENGFGYILSETYNKWGLHYIIGRLTSKKLTDADIVCEDADGDGYYFWGVSTTKPASCPLWAPDDPDGDDSNINSGPLDQFGFLLPLPNGVTINTAVNYSTNDTTSLHIGIVKDGTLTISGTTTLTGEGRIRVCEEGTLIIDGGTLQNARLDLIPGSHVIVRNNGTINMASGEEFNAPKGVIVDIEQGNIN